MCASSGTKVSLMNDETSSSSYDSASSRAHAPHAGAALKSTRKGFLLVLAYASAVSASFSQFTFMVLSPQLFSGLAVKVLLVNQRIMPGAMNRTIAVLRRTVESVQFQVLGI